MSWLVAVSFPGLLMLFTFGLQRLESLLHGERPSLAGLIARLQRTARGAGCTAVSQAAGELSGIRPADRLDSPLMVDEPRLPTRPNPVFRPSGWADAV